MKSWWRQHQWDVIIVLGLAAFLLGLAGFAQAGRGYPWLDCAYLSIQLFVLQSGAEVVSPPWMLEVARFVAPLTLSYAAVMGFLFFLRDHLRVWTMRWLRGHALIAGSGPAALTLARQFRRQGLKVILVGGAEGDQAMAEANAHGIPVLPGDPGDRHLLRDARIDQAAWLVCLTGDDGSNLHVAMSAYELTRRRPPGDDALRCRLELHDDRLRDLFVRHPVFSKESDRFEAEVFSRYEMAARDLFDRFPLETDDGGRLFPAAHLAIMGFGKLGRALLMQSALIGHLASRRPLRLTVFDRGAANWERRLRQRYPGLWECCDLTFVEGDLEDPTFSEGTWLGAPAVGPEMLTLAVCLEDAVLGLSRLLDLLEGLGDRPGRLLLRLRDGEGLAELLRGCPGRPGGRPLHPFAVTTELFSWDNVVRSRLDSLARIIHDEYRRRRLADGDSETTNPSLVSWSRLPEDLRVSNRRQADHIPVKLRALGLTCRPAPERPPDRGTPAPGATTPLPRLFTFTPEQVEILSHLEHRRWNADRFLSGWRRGPADKPRRVSPWLVPYEELPEEIKEYDREAVRQIPTLLAAAGLEIVPLAPATD
ncbi:MAG: hypothetical protein GX442_15740 [Candidatus Riflebacteria bacterium]|nr:hypothetical protein [Candidatus Riflebacteria bacterium]